MFHQIKRGRESINYSQRPHHHFPYTYRGNHLARPPNGHNYADKDRCRHDDSEQVLKDNRAGIRASDNIGDKRINDNECHNTDNYGNKPSY